MKARRLALAWCVAGAFALAAPAAAAPVQPKNATAKCTDGTYSTAKTRRGACTGHGGVATWLKEPKDDAKATKSDAKAPKDTKATKTDAKATKSDAKASAKTSSKAPKLEPNPAPPEPKTVPPPKSTPAQKTAPAPKTPTAPRPANSPANATAQCNDGTYSFAAQHRGACSRHGGVKTWFK